MRRLSSRPTWINLPSGESVRHAAAEETDASESGRRKEGICSSSGAASRQDNAKESQRAKTGTSRDVTEWS
jgi:hypothetical protein